MISHLGPSSSFKHHDSIPILFGVVRYECGVCDIVGLVIGIDASRNRSGGAKAPLNWHFVTEWFRKSTESQQFIYGRILIFVKQPGPAIAVWHSGQSI